jgi:hypothetical protein
MGTLFHYWIIPGKLRRLPRLAKIGLISVIIVLAVLFSSSVPYSLAIRSRSDYDYPPLFELFSALPMLAYNLLPSLLCILGLIAGAMAIAPERQKQTWEPLLLTRLRLTDVVHAKILVRIAQCLLLTLPLYLPLMLAYWLYSQNHPQYFLTTYDERTGQELPLSPALVTLRLWIYLIWTCVSTGGHLLMGTLLGMAISARCQKLQTALIFCGALIAFYGGTYFWCQAYYYYPSPGDPNLHAHLYYWPAVPYLDTYFTGLDAAPSQWKLNLVADIAWMAALPAVCYLLTLHGCRLRRGRMAQGTSDVEPEIQPDNADSSGLNED